MKRKNPDNPPVKSKKIKRPITREATHDENDPNNNPKNYPKRKVMLLVGYNGANYTGSQRNPDVKTVDSVLEDAIAEAGGISGLNRGTFSKVQWKSCCRTDKGVSAVGNIVTFKALMIPNFVEEVNKHLPDDMRVFMIRRVTGGFTGRNSCSSRIYQYLMPTFMFDPDYCPAEDQKEYPIPTYRIDDETLERVSQALQVYLGTNNYHNFTKEVKWNQENAKRYILSVDVGQPFEMNGIEWVNLTIQGQSFLYNQIRKMVGLLIFVIRDKQDPSVIANCFLEPRKPVPIAPSLGLFLNRVTFEAYNQKENPHGPILYDEILDELDRFMKEEIIKQITALEASETSFRPWLSTQLTFPMDYALLNSTQ